MKNEDQLLFLRNNRAELGLLPEVGGRAVVYRTVGGQNLLESNSEMWKDKPKPSVDTKDDFEEYNGHITWVGPQSGWWTRDGLIDSGKVYHRHFPPPWHIVYGEYEVMEQTDNSVYLRGPDCPKTGLRLEKKYSLSDDGKVEIQQTAVNHTREAIVADIWSNTRSHGNALCYIPITVREEHRFRVLIECEDPLLFQPLPFQIEAGYFHFRVDEVEVLPDRWYVGKSFIFSERGFIASFIDKQVFIKRADPVSADRIHEEAAFIEIYNRLTSDGSSLLEMEMHSSLAKLLPGEKMEFTESWEIRDLDSHPTGEERYELLNQL